MRYDSLVHLARIGRALAPDRRIVVLGSSALLVKFPELGEAGEILESSLDADLVVDGIDERLAEVFQEAIGSESRFESVSGYHADTMRPSICTQFPRGWEERLVPLGGCEGVFCLEEYDVAVAKLRAGRDKDIALLRLLVTTARLDRGMLRDRVEGTPMQESEIVRVHRRLDVVSAD